MKIIQRYTSPSHDYEAMVIWNDLTYRYEVWINQHPIADVQSIYPPKLFTMLETYHWTPVGPCLWESLLNPPAIQGISIYA